MYCWFEQDDWVRWIPIEGFAYNNSWQASTFMGSFERLLGYYPRMFYEDNCDPRSKSRTEDENAATLRDLMKKLKVNLTESKKLQAIYHNKNVKGRTYRPGDFVWLSGKHIKTKRNPKLEHKYISPLEILKAVRKQAYSSSCQPSRASAIPRVALGKRR